MIFIGRATSRIANSPNEASSLLKSQARQSDCRRTSCTLARAAMAVALYRYYQKYFRRSEWYTVRRDGQSVAESPNSCFCSLTKVNLLHIFLKNKFSSTFLAVYSLWIREISKNIRSLANSKFQNNANLFADFDFSISLDKENVPQYWSSFHQNNYGRWKSCKVLYTSI